MSGSATLDLYDPSSYIDSGGLIYVALQYRVGSHGFLYLGEDSGAPGNAGLLDQVIPIDRPHVRCFHSPILMQR